MYMHGARHQNLYIESRGKPIYSGFDALSNFAVTHSYKPYNLISTYYILYTELYGHIFRSFKKSMQLNMRDV